MGSKEEDVPETPSVPTRFVEDMNESEIANAVSFNCLLRSNNNKFDSVLYMQPCKPRDIDLLKINDEKEDIFHQSSGAIYTVMFQSDSELVSLACFERGCFGL